MKESHFVGNTVWVVMVDWALLKILLHLVCHPSYWLEYITKFLRAVSLNLTEAEQYYNKEKLAPNYKICAETSFIGRR